MQMPFLSVVIPCWNEARFVDTFLTSVLGNDYPAERMEVLLVDGMSDDGTRDIARHHAVRDVRLRLVDNPGHSKPVGLNRGIEQARGDVIIRLDVHAEYPSDYLRRCVEGLMENPEADNVGGVRLSRPRDDTLVGRAIAVSMASAFGAGNTKYRIGVPEPQWVDTVFGGCYRKAVFARIGMFDEKLTRAQDREFNQRLRRSGGKILLLPDITCTYYARSDLREFVSWTFEAGYWPFRASRSVGRWIGSWRNVVPVGFVTALLAGAALSPGSRVARRMTGALAVTYTGAAVVFAARLARQREDPGLVLALPVIFLTTHVVYGLGSLRAILDPRPGNR
ncbi:MULTISPECIES: glycosyltransferase family 2 protein [Actinoplanes]|uniref:glycosyltransferase family 2 protein n=1 Tax=Actinoplanes TaxID=1865 RepID=UPI0005F2AF76|nr:MULTISPECIES: glycosyltransferase family 2 protein [Actinoplanes]GLY08581.1 succinoglycan biosynthesis protein exoa [Actinoplanes sp. NBRC 101535]